MRIGPPTLSTLILAALALGLSGGCGWKLQTRGGDGVQSGPASEAGAAVEAASFSLANDDGIHVSLDELLGAGRPAILVFYRGHW